MSPSLWAPGWGQYCLENVLERTTAEALPSSAGSFTTSLAFQAGEQGSGGATAAVCAAGAYRGPQGHRRERFTGELGQQ